ncbi:MAG: Mur ligase domain-containing protein, partial [Cellvibrionales bacterium]
MIAGIAPAAFAERCGALWCPEGDARELTGLTVDSRTVHPGDLFVAVRGEQVDGHDYVAKAQAQGASAALVQRRLPLAFSQLVAEDTEHVLAEFAAMTREAYEGVLVGITGSAGKTTAKNMLCAVLG